MEGPLRFPYFIPGGQKTWSPWAILVSDWLKFKKSSLKLGGTMNCYFVGMMYWRSPFKIAIFRANHTTNMAAIGSSWL